MILKNVKCFFLNKPKNLILLLGLVLNRHKIVKEEVLANIREIIDNPRYKLFNYRLIKSYRPTKEGCIYQNKPISHEATVL